jgi:hypothetical protein
MCMGGYLRDVTVTAWGCEEQGRGVWCLGGARTRGLVFGRSKDEGFGVWEEQGRGVWCLGGARARGLLEYKRLLGWGVH